MNMKKVDQFAAQLNKYSVMTDEQLFEEAMSNGRKVLAQYLYDNNLSSMQGNEVVVEIALEDLFTPIQSILTSAGMFDAKECLTPKGLGYFGVAGARFMPDFLSCAGTKLVVKPGETEGDKTYKLLRTMLEETNFSPEELIVMVVSAKTLATWFS